MKRCCLAFFEGIHADFRLDDGCIKAWNMIVEADTMAYFQISAFANALCRQTTFDMFIPNDVRNDNPRNEDEPMRTLFLLHGYTERSGNWVPEELAEKYNLAIVMPNAENSFYQDGEETGRKFSTYIGIELVDYVRKTFGLAKSSADTFIMGLSMGGYGALSLGMRYPDRFGKIAALSSALIQHELDGMKPGQQTKVANYEYYRLCFGDLDQFIHTEKNPEVQAKTLIQKGGKKPEIFLCCGTEDFLIEPNRAFDAYLTAVGYAHVYREEHGGHNMAFWSRMVPPALCWMLGKDERNTSLVGECLY